MIGSRNLRPLVMLLSTAAALAFFPARVAAQTFTERIVVGFTQGTNVTSPPGETGRMFVTEQHTGKIHVVDLTTNTILATPFLEITGLAGGGEQGLLGLTFDPDFATNGYFYVDYTSADNSTQVVRYQVPGDPTTSNVADPDSALTILTVTRPVGFHNAGWIGFGPNDGYLYISQGDGGNHAQDITNGDLLGNILRIDVHSDEFPNDAGRNYAIPPTNPFVNVEGDDEIWAYGLRNPWRASFDRQTGDLWFGDVGGQTREEVDFQPADSPGGANYGWPLREGTIQKPGALGGPPPPGAIEPVYDYAHNEPDPNLVGNAVIGGYVYRGPVAAFGGLYFFADFGNGNLWTLDPHAVDIRASVQMIRSQLTPDVGSIARVPSFGEDGDGNLYMVESRLTNAALFRVATLSKDIVYNGDDPSAGAAGDGSSWGDADNWTRDGTPDVAFVPEDHVMFVSGSTQPVVDLQADRTVAAITFQAPFTLQNATLKIISGNVTVESGVTATIQSDLVADTEFRSIRKLGPGTLMIDGNAGQIVVLAGTLGGAGVLDHLTVRDGGTVDPGASPGVLTVVNSFTMTSGATLAIDIGGADNSDPQNRQFDQLTVGAAAQLAGALYVGLIDLGVGVYAPVDGDTFPIVTADDGIDGSFSQLTLPALTPELVWRTTSNGNTFLLNVVPRLPGDYNDDDAVNAADYTVWRNTKGQTGSFLAADGSGPLGAPDGIVDEWDYSFWKANYGDTAAPANGSTVPEPGSITLALLAACLCLSPSGRRMERVHNTSSSYGC